MKTLYTIGYATKTVDTFIQQLRRYNIDVVADVRSVPYSKAFADYHKENIIAHLTNNNIRYVYLGEELGPRSKDPEHYDESGQVQFEKLMTAPLFHKGLARLSDGLDKNLTIALMCAEKDPAICHRSLLIGHYLRIQSPTEDLYKSVVKKHDRLKIAHIRHDGSVEDQIDLENRVTKQHDKGEDLFMSEDDRRVQAYRIQLSLTSYRRK